MGLMPALMRHGHRVYAIDLLGFGRSDRPDVDYSIALQAEILNHFFDSQNLPRADLGGWSMGGWVALKFALNHPERVRRIFVADSAGINFKLPFDPTLFQPATVDQAQRLLGFAHAAGFPDTSVCSARHAVRRMGPMRWVVQRAMTSMMAKADLLDGKLDAHSGAGFDRLGEARRFDPAPGVVRRCTTRCRIRFSRFLMAAAIWRRPSVAAGSCQKSFASLTPSLPCHLQSASFRSKQFCHSGCRILRSQNLGMRAWTAPASGFSSMWSMRY